MLRNLRLISLWVLAALLFSACQPITAQTTSIAPPSDEDVVAAVNAIWDEYEASLSAGDVDRWVELWADEGIQLPPGEPPVVGKEAIRARNKAALTDLFDISMAITNEEVTVSGDWAVARGVYSATLTPKAGGDDVLVDGKYMTLLQRQADGSWKIYRDIFNSNVPQATVAAPVTDVDEVAAAINAVWREYEASLLAGDADRWIAQWMENGVQMPPNMPPRVGRGTIYTAVSGFLSKFDYTEFAITNEDVEVNGDLAFARGTYKAAFVSKEGGDPTPIEGKYMTILRQQEDGTWKIYRDIFNSNVQ